VACAGRAVGPDVRTAEACPTRFWSTLSFDKGDAQPCAAANYDEAGNVIKTHEHKGEFKEL
jgi:hypothetical protein